MLHKSTLNNVKTNKIEGLSKRRHKDGKFEFHKQTIFPVCILILALRLSQKQHQEITYMRNKKRNKKKCMLSIVVQAEWNALRVPTVNDQNDPWL